MPSSKVYIVILFDRLLLCIFSQLFLCFAGMKDIDDEEVDNESFKEEESDNEVAEEDSVDEDDLELSKEEVMSVWQVKKIWDHYRPRLLNDYTHAGYLMSPHPKICENASDPRNRDPKDRKPQRG